MRMIIEKTQCSGSDGYQDGCNKYEESEKKMRRKKLRVAPEE